MTIDHVRPRSPLWAFVFSLLCTGLGHIYCGRIVKGASLFLITLMLEPFAILVATMDANTSVLIAFLAMITIVIGTHLFAIYDAVRISRTLPAPYKARDYNHPAVYVLFAMIGLAYPIVVTETVKENFWEAFHLPQESMVPSLLDGDRVLVNKLAYRSKDPRRGDVVIFVNPSDRKQLYVKRVIGLPGDVVSIAGNRVTINGQPMHQTPVPSKSPTDDQGMIYEESIGEEIYRIRVNASEESRDLPRTEVEPGHLLLLGDNRNRARDSRAFGCVPILDVIGRVDYVFSPRISWDRFGAIGH